MSNYTKSTNFATKDNLSPGDPLKIVRGTEIDTEFNNISTAISTKTDNSAAAITGGSITGITDLAIADGGTGASTATAAINNLLPVQTSAANKYLQSDGTNVSWDAVTLSTADITGTLPVANGGTGVTSSTGTGNVVLSNSPTLVTPALGTPASGVATNLTGLPISTGVSGLGTGVATFLGTPSSANLISAVTDETGTGSLVFATSPTLVTPALGTPSALVGTNITGTASGLTAGNVTTNANLTGAVTSVGNATSLGSFSSANLLGALTDETGTGSAVFATSPTLVTPILGTPTSATLTNAIGLPIATGVSGLGTGVATFLATPSSANLAAALTDETGTGANVFATSPTLVTPILGVATATSLQGIIGNVTPAAGAFTTLSATGVTTLQAGTALLPALTTTGDTNTGLWFPAADTLAASTGGTERYRVDSSGNLGLGVTPSAWRFSRTALQLGNTVSAITGNSQLEIRSNAYLDASANEIYINSYFANKYIMSAGQHIWSIAPSGTAGNTISFTQAMTLDASGNLGVGTTSPLSLGAGYKSITLNGTTGSGLVLQSNGTSTGYLFTDGAAYQVYGIGSLPMIFSTNAAERMRLPAAGGVQAKTTISVGDATPSSSGAGITFPATQSASSDANTLDDYEEGTWTPSVGGTATYTSQVGRYTKVGRLVTFQCSVTILLIGTGSTTQISGLPFGGAAFNSANGGHAIYYDTTDSNVSQIVGYIGTTNIVLVSTTAFANSIGPNAIFKNGTTLTFQGFYFV